MTDDGLGDLHDAQPGRPGAQVAAALAEAATWVGRPGIEAVGLGEDHGGPCVVVYAGADASELPSVVGGLPVRVERTGPIQALDAETPGAEPDPPSRDLTGA